MANNTVTRPSGSAQEASIHDEPLGHGSSPAAWTCVAIMLIGALIASIGYVWASYNMQVGTIVFWIGPVVMIIGLIVGGIMRKVGLGVNGAKVSHH